MWNCGEKCWLEGGIRLHSQLWHRAENTPVSMKKNEPAAKAENIRDVWWKNYFNYI